MEEKYINKDEWYPVFYIDNKCGEKSEFTKEELIRIEKVFNEFDEIQELLRKRRRKK